MKKTTGMTDMKKQNVIRYERIEENKYSKAGYNLFLECGHYLFVRSEAERPPKTAMCQQCVSLGREDKNEEFGKHKEEMK